MATGIMRAVFAGACFHLFGETRAPAYADLDVLGRGYSDENTTVKVFSRLLSLNDKDLVRRSAFVMGETLATGNAGTDRLVNMSPSKTRKQWAPDPALSSHRGIRCDQRDASRGHWQGVRQTRLKLRA